MRGLSVDLNQTQNLYVQSEPEGSALSGTPGLASQNPAPYDAPCTPQAVPPKEKL